MPDKKSPDDKKKSSEEKSGGGKSLFTTIGVSIALIGVGVVVGGKLGGGGAAPVAAEPVVETTLPESEKVKALVDLDPINVNLADGHYLRVAVSLGLDHVVKAKKGYEFKSAPASDVVLKTFTGKTMDELSTPEGRDHAREEIAEALEPFYGHEIVSLYFTEFVMQ